MGLHLADYASCTPQPELCGTEADLRRVILDRSSVRERQTKRQPPQNESMSSEGPHDERPSVSRKDYDHFEFIARDVQEFAALQREEQIQRMFADPWSALSGFKGKGDTTFHSLERLTGGFDQIAIRGLKDMRAAAHAPRSKE
jgi:hypothetical protein